MRQISIFRVRETQMYEITETLSGPFRLYRGEELVAEGDSCHLERRERIADDGRGGTVRSGLTHVEGTLILNQWAHLALDDRFTLHLTEENRKCDIRVVKALEPRFRKFRVRGYILE